MIKSSLTAHKTIDILKELKSSFNLSLAVCLVCLKVKKYLIN